MKTRKQLKKLHGTPEEFERAVYLGFCDLFITWEEYQIAVAKYNKEWARAK